MARLPYITEGPSEVTEQIAARRKGDLRPLDQILLNSPDVALGWNTYLKSIREFTELDPLEREVLILRVAALTESQYEWDAHAKVALRAGGTQQLLDNIFNGQLEVVTANNRLLMQVAEEITVSTGLATETFQALEAAYSERQILEIVATVATYNMVSRVINSLHIFEETN